eukprot:947953-Prymnesium_polylepis.1
MLIGRGSEGSTGRAEELAGSNISVCVKQSIAVGFLLLLGLEGGEILLDAGEVGHRLPGVVRVVVALPMNE